MPGDVVCRILKEERNYILQMIKKIRASGANVLLIQKSILRDAVTDLSLHYLVQHGPLHPGSCPAPACMRCRSCMRDWGDDRPACHALAASGVWLHQGCGTRFDGCRSARAAWRGRMRTAGASTLVTPSCLTGVPALHGHQDRTLCSDGRVTGARPLRWLTL